MGRYRAIAWDLDGTLADTSADLAAAMNHLRLREGMVPLAVSEVRSLVGDGARALVRRGLAPDTDERTDRYVADFLDHYRIHCCDTTVLMPGIAEVLEQLAGIPHAIATNKPMEFTTPILRHLGVGGRFAAVYGAGSVPNRKPAPDMISAIARDLGLPPAEVLMVGDSLNDILAARAAGAASCAVSYGYKPLELLMTERPDHVIHTPGELVALLG